MAVRLKKFVVVNNMNKGFTLIELIIYIGIVAAILLVAVNFGWEIVYGNVKSQAIREVQQNARFSMEKITRALLSGELPITFSLSGGILYQDGLTLTNTRVKVTNFQITSIANTYKVNLTIEHVNPNNRSEYESSINLETTVSPR